MFFWRCITDCLHEMSGSKSVEFLEHNLSILPAQGILKFERVAIHLSSWFPESASYGTFLQDHFTESFYGTIRRAISSNQNLSVCNYSAVPAFDGGVQQDLARSRWAKLSVSFSCFLYLRRSPASWKTWLESKEGWAQEEIRGWRDWQLCPRFPPQGSGQRLKQEGW